MVKLKAPTPQELYRARKQREEQEKIALLPPGLYNQGNTCFMNSVLQGLIATRLLADLANFSAIPSVVQKHSSTPLLSARSPLLTNGRGIGGPAEQSWVNTMPIGDIFLEVMYRGWDIQLERRRVNLSPKPLLGTLGQKYDQYLDFAQQDAHEFLRILLDAMRMEEFDVIKKRQPPPKHVKKRRRTTLTPSNLHSSPTDHQDSISPPLIPEEQKLMSLSDMVFGGKLTSILVCQHCKHVSQTFEDFNDISLSLKAEDYQERKRDRLKNLAKRLTSFPTTFQGSTLVVSPEIPRPSSVPPSPSIRDGVQLDGHDEPPIADDPRRRSLDILATAGQEEERVPSTTASKEDTTSLESDKPIVEANDAVKPKRIEIVDPIKDERKKEKKDDSWAKIGRRLSMSVRLTKGKERTSRSKDRHSQDLLWATTSLDVPHSQDKLERTSIDGVISPKSTPRTSMSETLQGSAPSILLSRPSTPPRENGHESTSSSRSRSPSRSNIARFSTIRAKSPKPPKPTSAETEYLRQILADITPGSSTNPFGLLKPTFHHHSNRSVSAGSVAPTAQTLWLGMSQFSGIEDCLRMFTGVEILDGENMVGCRRCWKIANGMLPPGQPSNGQENADDDSDSMENDGPVAPPPSTREERNLQQSLPPLSPPMIHIPTSMSTPTVSLYPYLSNGNSRSVSSLPTGTDVTLLDSDVEPIESTPDQSASSLASTEDLDTGLKLPTTPGGLPIPAISTTGPDSPTGQPCPCPPSPLRDSASPITPPERVDPTSSSNPESDDTPIAHPTPRLAQVIAHLPPSSSGDSLVIPKARHGLYRSDPDSGDESSGTESEGSIAPSTDTSTSAEQSHDTADQNKSSSPLPVKKPSRPKPVIMRPAYKRYLIGVPPPVLVIHLKRFQQISKTHMMSFSHGFKKIDDYVTFPEYLDLTPYLAPKKEDFGLGKKGKGKMQGKHREKDDKCMYRLYAVVVHIGNMLGGHYIAYTALPNPLPQENGTLSMSTSPASDRKPDATDGERQWAYISDTVVRLTTLEEVLKAKAYICMYERI